MNNKKINNALISVFSKDGLDNIIKTLVNNKVTIYSTGGTYKFIKELGVDAKTVESLTGYPSILGGRVKTLHPKVFGGILSRRDMYSDGQQLSEYEIPEIDLVIVDLYPFEQTVAQTSNEQDIIEKIDIGGISLIRAAAKNYKDVMIVPSMNHYKEFLDICSQSNCETTIEQRHRFATYAFDVSSHYDAAIFSHFNKQESLPVFKCDYSNGTQLRYGENPHQKGLFFGNLDEYFDKLNGKEISYNNLGDIDAAVSLMNDFEDTTFAILKHNNACGIASRDSLVDAWNDALAGDPVSAFGGILITNRKITDDVAEEMNKIFFEVCIAPDYTEHALDILKKKKNRIILKQKLRPDNSKMFRSLLNGVLLQEKDTCLPSVEDLTTSVTSTKITKETAKDLLFATKVVKHTKSNAIVLAKNGQLYASGTGQTSRVDALNQAIEKAKRFGFDLNGAVMASDAFFPFADCVEIAHQAGITAVVHPGGSIHDQDSIDFCQKNNMAMAITGVRHFKH